MIVLSERRFRKVANIHRHLYGVCPHYTNICKISQLWGAIYIFVIFQQVTIKLGFLLNHRRSFQRSRRRIFSTLSMSKVESWVQFYVEDCKRFSRSDSDITSAMLPTAWSRLRQQQQKEKNKNNRTITTKPNESPKNQMSNRCNFLKQIQGHEKEVKSKKVSLSVRIRVNIKNLP